MSDEKFTIFMDRAFAGELPSAASEASVSVTVSDDSACRNVLYAEFVAAALSFDDDLEVSTENNRAQNGCLQELRMSAELYSEALRLFAGAAADENAIIEDNVEILIKWSELHARKVRRGKVGNY